MSEHRMGPRETALRRAGHQGCGSECLRVMKARLTDALDQALDAHDKAIAGWAEDAPTIYAEHEALNKRLRAIVLEAT